MQNRLQKLKPKVISFMATLILLFSHSPIYAHGQIKVTFSATNMSLKNFLKTIKAKTGYTIKNSDFLESQFGNDIFSVNFNNTDLDEILRYILKSSENIKVEVLNKSIIFAYKDDHISIDSSISGISGIVKDNLGNIIPGATIQIKNSNKGTTSDNSGRFSLQNIEKGSKILISSVGYQTKEYNTNNKTIIAELNPFINNLNETQVIAYGTRSKRLNTGNVNTITAKDITDIPVSNPMLALQGRIPGLDIQPTNGLAGSGVTIRVQNPASLLSGLDPLILVNGVPYPSQFLGMPLSASIFGTNGGTQYGQYGSPLSYINSNDIESISILKGADATAIYGSRAANGAILILTKSGKTGKTEITVDFQSGIKKTVRQLPLLNTPQYLSIRREALKNSGIINPGPYDYDINGFWDTTTSHNWQKELWGRTAFNMNSTISATGGTENCQYLLSGTFSRENYVYPTNFNSFNDTRGSGYISLNSSTPNKRLNINFTTTYMYDKNKPSTTFAFPLKLAPDAPNLLDKNETINWMIRPDGAPSWSNPIANNYNLLTNEVTSMVSNVKISYEIIPNLKLSSTFSYQKLTLDQTQPTTKASVSPYYITTYNFKSTLGVTSSRTSSWQIEPMLNYNIIHHKHSIELFAGSTFSKNQSFGRSFTAYNFLTDLLIYDIGSAESIISPMTNNFIYKYNALYGRANYNYNQKYIFQITGRRDGSSRFGENNKLHSFGSIAGAWIFTEERLIKEKLKSLSYGKIRSSYGTTGNDQIGDYSFLSLYQIIANRAYQGIPEIGPTSIPNPNLKWEEVRKWEIGLDLGWFENRLLLNLNYSINTSKNPLVYYPLAITSGFQYILENYNAKIKNSSLELNLTTNNITNNSISWNTIFNITIPKNKLLKFDNLSQSPYSSYYVIGKSTNIIKTFLSAGVNDTTGNFQFYDSKGNTTETPDPINDAQHIITFDPKFYGGITNSLVYKGFTLNFTFSFDKRYRQIVYPSGTPGTVNNNLPIAMLDRWQKPGDNATYQKYTANGSNFYQYYLYTISDRGFSNIFFIRCQNISITWELPSKLKTILKTNRCTLYGQVVNPFVFASQKSLMIDPQSGNGFPLLKTFNLGIKATF
ncbi:SusC/RagA family TonB-linked outer membrane protein [Chitinophaga silvatica]|uniref:SusC/RagA family TonB-linked outer membrane protein n=1 Tax=Chitinophaga silvatica TaxID=2282649 RepID=A0A3E1Y737_9BACT|nr:SusC/RagA family TonB-linked outer membrane protein [Chitinophaga silvatica]RFS20740.1 SusC/RagA family TonB-linked outer membrane protein [Chitinophaga silvatica]